MVLPGRNGFDWGSNVAVCAGSIPEQMSLMFFEKHTDGPLAGHQLTQPSGFFGYFTLNGSAGSATPRSSGTPACAVTRGAMIERSLVSAWAMTRRQPSGAMSAMPAERKRAS